MLIEEFFNSQICPDLNRKRQYLSSVFVMNDDERKITENYINELRIKGVEVLTEIITFDKFYKAEDYHQKYYLKSNTLIYNEVKKVLPTDNDINNSVICSKINSICRGFYPIDNYNQLKTEIKNKFGIELVKILDDIMSNYN